MKRFEIENITSGVILGEYEAESEADALNKMAQEAGYADFAAAYGTKFTAEGVWIAGDIVVTEVK